MARKRRNQTEKNAGKVIGYCRVSTDEQVTTGVSLTAQRERVTAFAIATERRVDEIIIDEGFSAKTLRRPGIEKVLAQVKAGAVSALIVPKLDRLTRSVRDLANLLDLFSKYDADLISVSESLDTSSAAGRMVVHMLGILAQWEREVIGERTATALGHKRRNCRVYGPTPYGFRRLGDAIIPDPALQPALTLIRTLDRESRSLRKIAASLTSAGYPPPRGKLWRASSVQAILESRMFSSRDSEHEKALSTSLLNGTEDDDHHRGGA